MIWSSSDTEPYEDYEETLAHYQLEWLSRASQQVGPMGEGLEAIDRYIGLGNGDILLCETTCLEYAIHALDAGVGISELWLIPPRLVMGELTDELLTRFESMLYKSSKEKLDSLEGHGESFKGLTTSVPEGPFKLLVTSFNIEETWWFEWPLYNRYWVEMLNTEGATGAAIYHSLRGRKKSHYSLVIDPSCGVQYPGVFTQSVDLPGPYVVFAPGEQTGSFHLEDLSDPSDPWKLDASVTTLVLNDACVVPCAVRHGVRAVRETTLGELASRINRGTTLSEKDLDIKDGLTFSAHLSPTLIERLGEDIYLVGSGGGHAPSSSKFYRYPGDYYYIDGTCFQDGVIRPKVLNTIPEGQGRYIVDSNDGEVLLVSRSSKEIAVYSPIKQPTLIGNSVFVVRLKNDIDIDYVACWLRGRFAKTLLQNEGKLLSKSVLSNLLVPILDEGVMEQTVQYERFIDEEIFNLNQRIADLKASNRFNPLNATQQNR